MENTSENINLKKLYWHSRRGMWELDIILVPFVQNEFEKLNSDEQNLYVQLLSEEDTDLFAWLVKEYICPDRYKSLIGKMINFARNNHEVPH